MSALQSLSSLVLHSSLVLAAATLLPACGGGETPQLATSEACVPAESVRIQLFGDSTQWAQGSAVQDWMDARYGVGLVRVSNHGVSGTTAADFPKSLVEPGAITVVNYGINDARVTSASVDVYKARLRAINATVYQTPNPPDR